MPELGKALLLPGGLLIVVGAVLLFGPMVPLLGKLPGDLVIRRESVSLSLPITTGIVLSILVSLLVPLINKFR